MVDSLLDYVIVTESFIDDDNFDYALEAANIQQKKKMLNDAKSAINKSNHEDSSKENQIKNAKRVKKILSILGITVGAAAITAGAVIGGKQLANKAHQKKDSTNNFKNDIDREFQHYRSKTLDEHSKQLDTQLKNATKKELDRRKEALSHYESEINKYHQKVESGTVTHQDTIHALDVAGKMLEASNKDLESAKADYQNTREKSKKMIAEFDETIKRIQKNNDSHRDLNAAHKRISKGLDDLLK